MATKLATVKALGKYTLASGLDIKQGGPFQCIGYKIATADCIDNAGTAVGYFDLPETVPAGSIVIGWMCNAYAGWTGDTSCTLIVGDGTTTDLYCDDAGAANIFTAGVYGAAMGDDVHVHADRNPLILAATTVRLTLTGATDFTLIQTAAAGAMEFYFFYVHMPFGQTA